MLVCCLACLVAAGCSQGTASNPKRGKEDARQKQVTGGAIANPHGAGALPTGGGDFKDAGPVVKLEGVSLTAPEGWSRKQPQSTFIQAEFLLPRVADDTLDARLTLSVAGGTIEANIDRWKDQFGGTPAKAQQEKMTANGLSITLVDFSGEFIDQRGPSAPKVLRADFRMIAGIIPAQGQLLFVKAVGPRKTMESHADSIKTFLSTAKTVR
jgi:hypothetical protein